MIWLLFLPYTHLHRQETEAHRGCEVRSIAKKQSHNQTLTLVSGIATPIVSCYPNLVNVYATLFHFCSFSVSGLAVGEHIKESINSRKECKITEVGIQCSNVDTWAARYSSLIYALWILCHTTVLCCHVSCICGDLFVIKQTQRDDVDQCCNDLRVSLNQPVFSHQGHTVESKVKVNSIPFSPKLERRCSLRCLEQIKAIFVVWLGRVCRECEAYDPMSCGLCHLGHTLYERSTV